MTMNRWSSGEGVENTEGTGCVTLKDARRTSNRYVPLLDSVVALSRSYFKQKKALTTHYNVSHLHKRDFVCTHGGCDKSYGYNHLLQLHITQAHRPAESSDPSEDDNEKGVQLDIDGITGKSYLERSAKIRSPYAVPIPTSPQRLCLVQTWCCPFQIPWFRANTFSGGLTIYEDICYLSMGWPLKRELSLHGRGYTEVDIWGGYSLA